MMINCSNDGGDSNQVIRLVIAHANDEYVNIDKMFTHPGYLARSIHLRYLETLRVSYLASSTLWAGRLSDKFFKSQQNVGMSKTNVDFSIVQNNQMRIDPFLNCEYFY